ncbi:MAG: hypothetical protein AAB354_12085 [candidate division KSB1 bacterium]
MATSSLSREALTQLKHQPLVQELARSPRNRLVQNEFIARYESYIRHTVTQAIYALGKMSHCEQMRDMADDVVNEIFYRLFRNECRVLANADLRYESSIFAYLRSMCQNMVRNYVRDYFQHEPLAHSYTAMSWKKEEAPCAVIEQIPNEESPVCDEGLAEACSYAAEIWRRQASFTQHLDRNLIIFKLHFIFGYHYDEIARIKSLGLGESGVGNTIARLKHRFQNETTSRNRLLH